MDTPDVIPITDFRRGAARIIGSRIAAERPVFITQGGYVTAIVLSPELYRDLVRRAEEGAEARREAKAQAARSRVDREPESVFGFLDAETAEILERTAGWDLE